MNLGGNILSNAQPGSSSASSSAPFSRDGGNGIFGDVRPQLKSVNSYDGFMPSNNYHRFDRLGSGGNSYGNSEYGGGILGGKSLTVLIICFIQQAVSRSLAQS